ncbi:hypothetical protein RhiirA1_408465 [Rhizophagus irregularis]|uniref:Uncharacterized protein n=1 Tax=Rhizophagus irregularis TaxID=588596 RepID=A0A2N0SH30_9GLOM|nr:hypothetical protein RhiirA1_408465 [Rhizophagus irregularis]
MEAIIYLTPSAVNETYKCKNAFFWIRFLIFPLQIIIHGIKVFMATLGSSDQAELNLQVLVIVHLFIISIMDNTL